MSWKDVLIGDYCQVLSAKRIFANDYVSNGIPFYRSKEIIYKAFNQFENDEVFIKEERFNEIKNKFGAPKRGDVLISSVGNRSGISYWVKEKYDFYFKDGNLIWFRNFNDKMSSKYLVYFLNSELGQAKINNMFIGAAQKALTIEGVKRIKLSLPPLPTQKRIADILSAYDDLIENNLKRIKLLEQAAQNIYKEWFVNLRFPGHENTPINKKTGLPEGWEKKLFEDVSVNNNRKRIPLNGIERSKRQGDYRYYGATGVMDYIDDYIFEGRFLLVAEDGTVYDKVGNAYTQLVEGKFWVNNHAHIISSGGLPVEYLYLTMKHYPIGHLITGAVQLKLSMKNLKRVEVINPSEEILEKFLSIVNPMINQVFKLSNQNQKLKSARDILLPRLMNRTIEV